MAPRTRATTSSIPPPTLAAAPRRRLKVTPLDSDETIKITKKNDLNARPATRSTRGNTNPTSDPTQQASQNTTAKPRGRPKKAESAVEDSNSTSEPKRVTRSTRATSTTASSEAKEKSTAKTRKTAAKDDVLPSISEEPIAKQDENSTSNRIVRKKVTFQDLVEDDKENQPLTRAAKKTATSKSTKAITATSTGLRAKPVRKPATFTTKSTKRAKEPASDDEQESQPRKIQRILTPKKVTQMARAATPDIDSEDELNGAKTPCRDLSLSPKRPQSAKMTAAIAKTISPVKPLNFDQSLLNKTQNVNMAGSETVLASPAKRPASSTKLFTHSPVKSPVKVFNDELDHPLASPAKRPAASPVKVRAEGSKVATSSNASRLLFPTTSATKRDHVPGFAQSATKLLQSPKRPATFDSSRIFAQSAVKPQSKHLSKSHFFSSPAKRGGLSSPVKEFMAPSSPNKQHRLDIKPLDELDLNEIEVTNLLEDGVVETSVTSCQRRSTSPLKLITLSEYDIEDELDNSILPVRSPMKIAKSPEKTNPAKQYTALPEEMVADEDATEMISTILNSPYEHPGLERSFVSLQAVEDGTGPRLEDDTIDLAMDDVDDDTIVLPENMIETPTQNHVEMYDVSQDELAISAGEDMMAKFVRIPGNTPRTPASLYEHELTQMLSSPDEELEEVSLMQGTPCVKSIVSTIQSEEAQENYAGNPAMEAEISVRPSAREASGQVTPSVIHKSMHSPASLYENEMTMMGTLRNSPDSHNSPVGLSEHELTMMAERYSLEANPSPIVAAQIDGTDDLHSSPPQVPSPSFIVNEHELTIMGNQSQAHKSTDELEKVSTISTSKPATPSVPILRKFNINTIVTKVPLKPEGQESPIKLNIKKRKRPFSLGGNPDNDSVELFARPASVKTARTQFMQELASPSHTTAITTPASNMSTRIFTSGSARRVVSAPMPRSPLTPVVGSGNDVLNGAVVYVDVRTSEGADASAIYIDLLTQLGAKILKEWKDCNPTHVVYKDGRPKTLEKVRLAAADGQDLKCVGVAWPLDCEAQKSWVDESSYLLKLTPSEQILGSVTKSARRKSMEPSMLIADGAGSIKRSRSRSRLSMGGNSTRRSIIAPNNTLNNTPSAFTTGEENIIIAADELATPVANAAKKHAEAGEKLSLTAAWKSINATQNLGDDTPARKTLDLLQRSYAVEQSEWDSTILSNENDENDENENVGANANAGGEDMTIVDTGLTPAPYRTKQQIGSAPGKITGVGFMSYRERVEEMERRELRDGAKGVKGGQRGKKDGRRVTIFGN